MPKFTFRIQRFNPSMDKAPFFKSYKVTLPEGATVLDGLMSIKSSRDGTLTFRRSCRSAICGSCACRVNGRATLICDLQAEEAAKSGVITLEPLANFDIIRDLVVNLEPFWKAVEKALPWIIEGPNPPEKEYTIIPSDDFVGLGKVDVCVLCAACHSDCRVLEEHRDWPGPILNVKTARFILDVRDNDPGRAARAKSAGLKLCLDAEKKSCPVKCPKGIDMAEDAFMIVKKRP
jgi:succinate dehydrogenase/fumarate reductase iron-sulfur protein